MARGSDKRLKFQSMECSIKGLRYFNITGYGPLLDEFFDWLTLDGIGFFDVQQYQGKEYAFYQSPQFWKSPWATVMTVDVAFRNEDISKVLQWKDVRYCEIND